MRRIYCLLVSLCFWGFFGAAQTLDPSFGNGGKLVLQGVYSNSFDTRLPSLVQADGKILVVGKNADNTNMVVCRLTPEGAYDPSFGTEGKILLNLANQYDAPRDVKLQSDGKILVAANTTVYRLNADGSADLGFNTTGKVTLDFGISKIIVQADGKIVAGGNAGIQICLMRLNSNGSTDLTFGVAGKFTRPSFSPLSGDSSPLEGLVEQADGKLVAAGYCLNPSTYDIDFYVLRCTESGVLDASFAGVGYRFAGLSPSMDFAAALLTSTGNKTTVSGTVTGNGTYQFLAARFNEDGSFDNTFNGSGKVATTPGTSGGWNTSIAYQGDGGLLMAGYSPAGTHTDMALTRFEANGTLDNTFNSTGSMAVDFGSSNDRAGNVLVLANSKVLLAGHTNVNGVTEVALVQLISQKSAYYRDADGDGFGNALSSLMAYAPVAGYVADNTDCHDNNASIHPGATEVCGNGVDENCNGEIDEGCPNRALLSINDVTLYEGEKAVLTVTLSKKVEAPVEFYFSTADGTAKRGKNAFSIGDYFPVTGSMVIPAGSQTASIQISVRRDWYYNEAPEYFYVNISRPSNAAIGDGTGMVTILDVPSFPVTAPNNQDINNETLVNGLRVQALPNPSTNNFNLQLQSNQNQPLSVRVLDNLGRLVETRNNVAANTALSLGNHYRAGVYFVEVVQGHEKKLLKLIKQ